jgi:hypothetical protein
MGTHKIHLPQELMPRNNIPAVIPLFNNNGVPKSPHGFLKIRAGSKTCWNGPCPDVGIGV